MVSIASVAIMNWHDWIHLIQFVLYTNNEIIQVNNISPKSIVFLLVVFFLGPGSKINKNNNEWKVQQLLC